MKDLNEILLYKELANTCLVSLKLVYFVCVFVSVCVCVCVCVRVRARLPTLNVLLIIQYYHVWFLTSK